MKCKNCGAELRPGEAFCGECGTKVPEEPMTQAVETTEAAKCQNCGAEIKPDEMFCGECGAKVGAAEPAQPAEEPVAVEEPAPAVEEPAVLKCQNCGAELQPDEMFCGECGTAVQQSAPATAAAPVEINNPAPKKEKKPFKIKKSVIFIAAGCVALIVAALLVFIFVFNGFSSSKEGKLKSTAWVSAGKIEESKSDSDSDSDSDSKFYLRFNDDGSIDNFTKYSDDSYYFSDEYKYNWSVSDDLLIIREDKTAGYCYFFNDIDEDTLKTKKGKVENGDWFVSGDYFVMGGTLYVPVSNEDFDKYLKEAKNYEESNTDNDYDDYDYDDDDDYDDDYDY